MISSKPSIRAFYEVLGLKGKMSKIKTMIIVQPYVPKYRFQFFARLVDVLAESNINCRVAAAMPVDQQASRGDAVNADWIIPIRQQQLHLAGHTITLGGASRTWSGADGVIVGHLGSSLDTYRAILDARLRGRFRVGLWGHIKSYVADSHPLDAALERWQLRQADHVFAYSPGGAAYAASVGVLPRRLTTVMNSVDTHTLSQARTVLTETAVAQFMSHHGLSSGRTLGFIGGLDESKRISFIAAALDRLWATDPDLRLLVGGSGSQSSLLDDSVSRGQTIRLGYAGPSEQALIGRAASALIMPGRIGLVAVDALLLKLPILTTDWSYHSAEAEYLTEGTTRFTAKDDLDSYVTLIQSFMRGPGTSKILDEGNTWNYPTIDNMVANFSSGVLTMLSSGTALSKHQDP
ncbi:glycosyltransferase [Arthrobacter sp. Hiyo6]|nr:glycosyltransferase [Arthrobacter sp. Hiyo6]